MDFRILGPVEVHAEDGPIAVGGAKQRALLAMLLLNANEVVSSDRLIAEVWADEGLAGGTKALQVAISRLRRALGPGSEMLLTRSPGYELRLEPGQLDRERFEREVAGGREALRSGDPARAADSLHAALSLWRGPALADVSYEQFAQVDIGRLEDLRIAALEDRIDADLALGRHAELGGELERLVAEHPYRERLWSSLMLALYRSGRQAEALAAYRRSREVLVDELGIEPSRELKDLEGEILAQDPALDLDLDPGEGPSRDFVGREPELAALREALDRARAGAGAMVLVGGEPGIGKSRLGEELAARAKGAGVRCLTGRCWEAGGAPTYWPWIQALRAYLRVTDPARLRPHLEAAGPDLATILPDLFPEPPAGLAPEADRFALFASVARFLLSVAGEEPLALVLDDLHAADEASVLLLRYVAGELQAGRVLIVGCYRDTEIGPGTPLGEALPDLGREPAVTRLALGGLDRDQTALLLEATTGEPPSAGLADRVHAETAGNPLFAGQYGHLIASGETHDTGGGLPIPEGVTDVISRRLARQSDSCRRVLTLASVLGREFELDVLELVCGVEQAEVYAALEEGAAARIVGSDPDVVGRMRFSHVVIRDALYEELAATRRPGLHLAAGEALEEIHRGYVEPHLAELAHHYLAAGRAGAAKAIGYATRAGDRAASQLGYEEAARQYGSALDLLEAAGPADAEATCALLVSLGEVLSRAGRSDDSKEVFGRAAEIAEREDRPDLLARAALGYGGRFAWGRASKDPGLVPLLERALAAVGEGDSPARVRLLARLASAFRDEPDRDRRVRLADEARDMARRLDDPVTLAYALEACWAAVESPDEFDGRLEDHDELIALGRQIGDKEKVYVGHEYRLQTFWVLGDRAGVDVESDVLVRLAEDLRQPAHRWSLGVLRAELALMEGRFDEAETLIAETAESGGRAQSWNASVSRRLALFVLRREQGRLGEIAETIERSVHEFPALIRFRCALANLYAEVGREAEARAVLTELVSRDLAREHKDAEWLFAMNLLPDVCAALGDAASAERLMTVLLPYERLYAQAPSEAASGSVARGLGVLATTLERFDEAERRFGVALEMERRMRARPWIAHAQHDLAAMYLARGGPGDPERAGGLRDDAVRGYRELAMDAWARRAEALAPG